MHKYSIVATVLTGAIGVAAHGHVSNIVVNSIYYQNYDPTVFPYSSNPPTVIGWTAADLDNGFIAPDAFGTGDIICHKNATNAGGHATVAAGDYISLQWTVWPDSHHGPVIDYLANCNGNCETVDKMTLKFFKIDAGSWVSGSNPGLWASDTLIANNNTWLVQIPANLAAGNYVLRHEIIALHGAGQTDGAQSYPQCINLQITGTGTLQPSGTYGTALYQETDPGILFNLYTSPIVYTVPGPTLVAGLSSTVPQSSLSATVTSSATVPGAGTGGTTTVGTTSKTTSVSSTSTVKSTTMSTVTTSAPTSTTSAPTGTGSTQSQWGQCGGSGWTGPTLCASGTTCSVLNPYYYQCL